MGPVGGAALSVQRFYSIGLLLCAGFALLSGCSGKKKEEPKQRPPVPVLVTAATLMNVPVQLQAVGNVEPQNTVSVKAQVNGQIAMVHFREGQDVRKNEVLFTLDTRTFEATLKQAEAALAKDLAQARFAREQAQRYGGLLKEGIVTQDQYDQLRTNLDAVEAAVAADRAAVENARIQLSYCTIRSPIDGRTGSLMVQAGNLVKANDNPVLVTINQVTPVNVTFSLPEREMASVRKHLAGGKLPVEATVPNGGAPESGIVSFMDNAVDQSTGMIKLKGTFANRERKLWPGQFVNVSVTLSSLQNAVVVPAATVQTGQQGQYVYVVKQDGTAELRPVISGVAYREMVVLQKGVQPGETVVTDGQMRLMPGAKVEIKKPAQPGPPQNGSAKPANGKP